MKRINTFRALLHFALAVLLMVPAVMAKAEDKVLVEGRSMVYDKIVTANQGDQREGRAKKSVAIRGRVVDEKGVGIEGVVVSEGFNVARSGRMGEFNLERSPRAKFVFISSPSGYEHIGPFYYTLEPANKIQTDSPSDLAKSNNDKKNISNKVIGDQYKNLPESNISQNKTGTVGQSEILFPLRKTEKESNLFIHTGDTEESVYRDWMDILKENIANNDYAFVLFNGDICYEPGLRLHAEHFTTGKLGVRIVYSVGNHDLVDGAYGEELFEQLFGPVWYSFNVGGVHFINTPVLTGDRKPSYNADDMYNWMRKDLESIPEGTPVVLFNHHLLGFEQKFKLKTETQELDLGKYNLKGYLHAHYHTNLYHKTDRGVAVMASMSPNKGGKDHSPSSFRVVEFDTLGNLSTHLKYSPLRKHIVANAFLTAGGDVCNLVAAIYDTPSEVVEATVMIAGAEYQLTQNSNWSWSTNFEPSSEAKNIMRPAERLNLNLLNPVIIESKAIRHNEQPKLKVKFSDGSTVITLVNILEGAQSAEIKTSEGTSTEKEIAENSDLKKSSRKHKAAKTNAQNPLVKQQLANSDAGNTNVAQQVATTDTKNSPKIEWVKNLGGNIFMTSPLITENLVISATTDDNMALDAAICALDRVTGEVAWKFNTHNSVKNNLHLYNGVVFAADVEGFVYAIDAQSGELKWEKPLRKNIIQYPYTQGVVVSRGVVYAGQGYYLTALDAVSGEILWVNTHWRGDVATVANPIVDEANNILLTAAYWTGRFAHDATTGKLIWEKRDGDTRYADNSPVLFDGKFYYASPGFITEVDPMSGEELMKFKIDYRINSNSRPLVTEKYYITGTTDKGVVAYDRTNGYKELWNFKTNPALLYTAPYTKDFQMTVDGGVALKGNNLYFGANDGYIYCVDVRNGRFIWRINTGSPILGNLVIEGDTLYIADFAGNLWAVK